MNVGVLGTGFMGRNHARIYSHMKDVDRVIVYDLNRPSAEETEKIYGVKSVDDIETFFENIEAVSICTPNSTHLHYARETTARGIHTLIEKPISDYNDMKFSYPDGVIVGVGHIERFNPIVGEIKKIVTKPSYIKMMRHNPSSERHKGTTSVVEDLMIHDVDVLLHSLMSGEKINDIASHVTDDIAVVQIQYACGTIAEISASRMSAKKIRSIYIECPSITIEGDYLNQEVFVYRKPEKYSTKDQKYVQENIVEKVLINRVEPLQVELQTFIDCIRNNRQFPVSVMDAFDNVAFCQRIKTGDVI